MDQKRPLETNPNNIQNFDSLEMTQQPLLKENSQKLLEKNSPHKFIMPQERNQRSDRNLFLNEYQNDLSSDTYCYPIFLSKIGLCCTPFKICCPCIFCDCCICKSNPLFQQPMQSLGLLQEWGHFTRILEPGLHVINPISQSIIQINQQTKLIEYKQIGISKDNVQFDLSVVVFYRVTDSLKLAYRLGNYDAVSCLTEIASGTLRNVLGENMLQTIIDNRALITHKFTWELNKQVSYWGLYVEVCSLKQITIDKEIQQTMQAVTRTKRLSEAMIINFKAEVECGKLIKEIADIINNQASFQIRYLNMIEAIIANGQENVIFMKTSMDKATDQLTPK